MSVYIHEDGSILIVYVDDVLMVADRLTAKKHWFAIGSRIDFKDPAGGGAGANGGGFEWSWWWPTSLATT